MPKRLAGRRAETGRNGLTPRQEQAAISLAAGATLDQTSEQSGAGLTTSKTWLADCPALPLRIAELRAALTERAVGRLAASLSSAADTLEDLCANSESEGVRLKAAEAILTHALKVREAVELADRITRSEDSR